MGAEIQEQRRDVYRSLRCAMAKQPLLVDMLPLQPLAEEMRSFRPLAEEIMWFALTYSARSTRWACSARKTESLTGHKVVGD